jgi:hypothetical protein
MILGSTGLSARPSLPRACLAAFLIVTLPVAGITLAPGQAAAADTHSSKAKKEKKEKKDKADAEELQAREAFAAGRYSEAVDLYAKLYAETLHPTYLRNVGRCYMNIDQPDRAATSFREYLRKAKDISPTERQEVEGFIAEMEKAQKKKDDAAAAATAKPVDPTPPPPKPVTNPIVNPPPTTPAPARPTPFYAKGWFWGVVVGVVVVGVAGGLYFGGVFSSKKNCASGYTCLE